MEGSARIIIQEGGAPPPDPRILPLAPVRHAGDCHVDGGVILRGGGRPLKQAREASDTGAIRNDLLRPFSSTAIPASLQGFLLQVLRPAWGRRAFFYNFFLGEGEKKLLAQKTGTPISLPLSILSWSSRVHTPLPRDRVQAMATVGHTSVAGGSLP